MLKFSEDHEWARLDAEICSVGISPHAVEQLGDIVFVELPEIGTIIDKGDEVAVIESVKAASDIYSPAAGQITDVNNALLDDLSSITPESAMENWLFKLKISDISDLDQLMDEGVAQLFTLELNGRKLIGTVGALQYEVIQYRLEHEYYLQGWTPVKCPILTVQS